MTITKAQYADYMRLKKAESEGHMLTTDCLRFIVQAHNYDAESIGKHFLELYGKWYNEKK